MFSFSVARPSGLLEVLDAQETANTQEKRKQVGVWESTPCGLKPGAVSFPKEAKKPQDHGPPGIKGKDASLSLEMSLPSYHTQHCNTYKNPSKAGTTTTKC